MDRVLFALGKYKDGAPYCFKNTQLVFYRKDIQKEGPCAASGDFWGVVLFNVRCKCCERVCHVRGLGYL